MTTSSSTNRLRALALLLGVALAVSLLVLVAGTKPAKAAFPGTNGKIAFANYRDDDSGEIYMMNPNGTGKTRLTNNPAAGDSHPALSPDEKKIAFTSFRTNNYEIYTMDAADDDGDNPKRLTRKGQFHGIAFSPDGQKIAYDKGGRRGGIFTMNADGTNKTRITSRSNYGPSWGPAPPAPPI